MGRRPGQRFPSDGRQWFRVTSDILDDPRFLEADWVLASYIRVLAMLKRKGSRDGSMHVSHAELQTLMGARRRDVAEKRLARLAHVRLTCAARYEHVWLILLPKWPTVQGIRPETSGHLPRKYTGTETETEIREERERAPNPTTQKRLLNLLSPYDGTDAEKLAWWRLEEATIRSLAERDFPDDLKRQKLEVRSRIHRHYKQHLKGTGKPSTSTEAEMMQEATRKRLREIGRFSEERLRLLETPQE